MESQLRNTFGQSLIATLYVEKNRIVFIRNISNCVQLTCQMGKGACGVEADISLDTLREDAGKNGLAQRAVRNSFL